VEFMRELDLKCLRVDLDNRTLTPLEKIAQGGRSGLLSLSPGTTPCQLRAGAGRGRRQRLHFSECCRRHREHVLRWLSLLVGTGDVLPKVMGKTRAPASLT
jgi:hypothetical protein